MATALTSSNGTYQYSFVLSGLVGVGKTSIFNFIKQGAESRGDLVEVSQNEGGLDCCIYSTTVKGVRCKISLFDTGGLERYASLTSNYYHRCNAVILVYLDDSDRLDTLTCLNTSVESARCYNKFPDTLVFSLWGNQHKTLTSSLSVESESTKRHIDAFLETFAISPKLHFLINPQTGEGIFEAMDSLVWEVHCKVTKGECPLRNLSESNRSNDTITTNGNVGSFELYDANTPLSSSSSERKRRFKCCLK